MVYTDGHETLWGPLLYPGEFVGVGINVVTRQATFIVNGTFVGAVDIPPAPDTTSYYLTIGMTYPAIIEIKDRCGLAIARWLAG